VAAAAVLVAEEVAAEGVLVEEVVVVLAAVRQHCHSRFLSSETDSLAWMQVAAAAVTPSLPLSLSPWLKYLKQRLLLPQDAVALAWVVPELVGAALAWVRGVSLKISLSRWIKF
jgi:hypothetical protein